MIDVGFGPAVIYLIVIFCILPGVLGFVVGVFGSVLIFRRTDDKKTKIALALLSGLACAALFPVMVINIESRLRHYGERRVFEEIQKYERELPGYFSIKDVKLVDSEYEIILSVARSGQYTVIGRAYQEGVCRGLFSTQLKLDSGVDSLIRGELNDAPYDKYDACRILYDPTAAVIPQVSVGKINSQNPIDFVIEAKSRGDTLPKVFSNKIGIAVTNPGSVIRDGSIIFFSPNLSKNGNCPTYNHMQLSVCVGNERLRFPKGKVRD